MHGGDNIQANKITLVSVKFSNRHDNFKKFYGYVFKISHGKFFIFYVNTQNA